MLSDFSLKSPQGFTIYCSHLFPEKLYLSKMPMPCIIYAHSHSGSKLEGQFLLDIFIGLGVSILLFDFSGSGTSSGPYVTLGLNEKDDLLAVMKYCNNCEMVQCFGVWGRSMGAASFILSLYESNHPKPNKLKVVVLDSPFDKLKNLIRRYVEKSMDLPQMLTSTIVNFVELLLDRNVGIECEKINPSMFVEDLSVPTCFLVARDDTLTPVSSVRKLFLKTKMVHRMFQVINGDHKSKREESSLKEVLDFVKLHLFSSDRTQERSARLGVIQAAPKLNMQRMGSNSRVRASSSSSSSSSEAKKRSNTKTNGWVSPGNLERERDKNANFFSVNSEKYPERRPKLSGSPIPKYNQVNGKRTKDISQSVFTLPRSPQRDFQNPSSSISTVFSGPKEPPESLLGHQYQEGREHASSVFASPKDHYYLKDSETKNMPVSLVLEMVKEKEQGPLSFFKLNKGQDLHSNVSSVSNIKTLIPERQLQSEKARRSTLNSAMQIKNYEIKSPKEGTNAQYKHLSHANSPNYKANHLHSLMSSSSNSKKKTGNMNSNSSLRQNPDPINAKSSHEADQNVPFSSNNSSTNIKRPEEPRVAEYSAKNWAQKSEEEKTSLTSRFGPKNPQREERSKEVKSSFNIDHSSSQYNPSVTFSGAGSFGNPNKMMSSTHTSAFVFQPFQNYSGTERPKEKSGSVIGEFKRENSGSGSIANENSHPQSLLSSQKLPLWLQTEP